MGAELHALARAGRPVVVVYGGGPQIERALHERGVVSTFVRGLRVTTPEMVDVLEEVLHGEIGPAVVEAIEAAGSRARAMEGNDGLLRGCRRAALADGEPVDWGLVGDVQAVAVEQLHAALDDGAVPVVSTLAIAEDGSTLNVNADTTAAAVATAMGAHDLVILTDVAGVYRDWPDPSSLAHRLGATELASMLPELAAGMVPKAEACLRALRAGVGVAHVVDGRVDGCIVRALVDETFGTKVVLDGEPEGDGAVVRVDDGGVRTSADHVGAR